MKMFFTLAFLTKAIFVFSSDIEISWNYGDNPRKFTLNNNTINKWSNSYSALSRLKAKIAQKEKINKDMFLEIEKSKLYENSREEPSLLLIAVYVGNKKTIKDIVNLIIVSGFSTIVEFTIY